MRTVLPLLLVGCLDIRARPYDEFLLDLERLEVDTDADTDTDTDTDTDADTDTDIDTDPPFEPSLCSIEGGGPITVTIENLSPYPADLYWARSDCSTQNIVLLAPGASSPLNTTVGHAFWLRHAFDLYWIDEVRIAEGDTIVGIGAAP
ncbi:MAG: hypothetical protein R3F61_26575 [Myxococcota bacterium]